MLKDIIVDMHDKNAPSLFSSLLHDIGFVVLVNHSISATELNDVYSEWKYFFSSNEKFQYIRGKNDGEGYVPLKIEHAKEFSIPDIKEFYHFYKWGRQPKNINTCSTIKLYDSLLALGEKLLGWLDQEMPKILVENLSMPLKKMIENSNRHLLRLLHYPPVNHSLKGMRSAPHTDINLLTLLPASTASGLELRDKNGTWHKVAIEKNSIIVNAADMLDLCTSGYYKSVIHRVNNPIANEMYQSRYSAPFFMHPRHDVDLKDGFTVREYWIQRLKEIGLYYDYVCIDES